MSFKALKPRLSGVDQLGRSDSDCHNVGGLVGSGITSSGASGAVSAGLGTLQQGLGASGLGSSIANGNVGLNGASNALTTANSAATNPFSSNYIGQNFTASPGYQFEVNQAQAAQNNSAAAQGGLLSGNQQLAGQNISSQLANQNYYQYIGAQQNGLGQYLSSALGLGGLGTSAGSSIFGGYSGLGQIQTNALTGAAESEGQQASSGINGLIGGLGALF